MTSPKKRRIKVQINTPNPLFEQWITEWRDTAKEKGTKMQYTLGIALKSLHQYPLPLESGKQCKILKGFGDTLCKMLDDKLKKHNSNRNVANNSPRAETKQESTNLNLSNNSAGKEYIPQKRSGAYAILMTLYEEGLRGNYPGFLLKSEIISLGQKWCETSLSKPDAGSFYCAWNSMANLIKKNLVSKQGNPARFSLTDTGTELGEKLYIQQQIDLFQSEAENNNDLDQPSTSKAVNKNKKKNSQPLFNLPQSSKFSAEDLNLATEPSEHKILSRTASTSSTFESVIFPPNSFQILLLVDKQELNNKSPEGILNHLSNLKTPHEQRDLKVGDYLWIARDTTTKTDLVLPYIVERKRMDDLGSSIKDGRFYEQKFRLRQSGVRNLIYLIEDHGDNSNCGLDLKSLLQGATNTLVQDEFSVKFTHSLKETGEYLACLTNLISKMFQSKTLVSCAKEDIKGAAIDEDLACLMTFREFNLGSSKTRHFRVGEMFIKQLLQIKGLSVEKALAVTEKYKTPRLLLAAYKAAGPAQGEKLLAKLQFGQLKKCIGPVLSRTIHQFFCNDTYR